MNTETRRQLANDAWSIGSLLRGPYKRNGYEIPLKRHFYRDAPPRELAVIESEIKALETHPPCLSLKHTLAGFLCARIAHG